MTLLIYAFFAGSQLMMGMAEFDSMQRCLDALPNVQASYPGAGAACVIVRR
jgi:hypothetical protein